MIIVQVESTAKFTSIFWVAFFFNCFLHHFTLEPPKVACRPTMKFAGDRAVFSREEALEENCLIYGPPEKDSLKRERTEVLPQAITYTSQKIWTRQRVIRPKKEHLSHFWVKFLEDLVKVDHIPLILYKVLSTTLQIRILRVE